MADPAGTLQKNPQASMTRQTRLLFPLVRIIACVVPILASAVAGGSSFKNPITGFWECQYQAIESGIRNGPRFEPGKNPHILDEQALILTTDKDPVDVQLRRTRALLTHLKTKLRATSLTPLAAEVSKIATEAGAARAAAQADKLHELHTRLRDITRKAALANPLLNFDDLLFMGYMRPGGEKHMMDQYVGWNVYTRWDYVDRDDCVAHHLWTCYPDGRDPRSPHGNYPPAVSLSRQGQARWPAGET